MNLGVIRCCRRRRYLAGAGGRCAGADVPGHIHAHIVPRWNGDINFTTVLGNVRVIPQAIEQAYAQLKAAVTTLS